MINNNYNYLDIKNQPFLVDLISYGGRGKNRTLISGFGDHYSTIKLHSHIKIILIQKNNVVNI